MCVCVCVQVDMCGLVEGERSVGGVHVTLCNFVFSCGRTTREKRLCGKGSVGGESGEGRVGGGECQGRGVLGEGSVGG